ncbi:MAG: response regulator [Polyangiales bacterium]
METALVSSRIGTVLVIEDDPLVASAIRNVLEEEGYRAEIARNVSEANACFAQRLPALILLDWNLPDGSGEDVVRAVRPLDASVPFVVMSAIRDSLVDSYAIEASERLAKPFDLDRLVSLVRRYLG